MNQTHQAALQVLYHLAREDAPADLVVVAEMLGLSCVEADDVLAQLEQGGWVDADRVRLTMSGLVIAASTYVSQAERSPAEGPRRSASRAA